MRFLAPLASSLVLAALAIGCAAPHDDADPNDDGAASSSQDITSAKEPGLDVTASWRRVVTGVPTYGYDATEPFLTVGIGVDDGAVRAAHPGFDGLERPFVLVPRASDDGSVRWERVDLRYRGQSSRGYYGQIRIDRYETEGVKLSEKDLAAALSLGVAAGIDSNVGTIWAQDHGANFRPAEQRYGRP